MITFKTIIFDVVLKNGLVLIVPPIVLSLLLWPYLPKAFGEQAFDEGIPKQLLICENILRMIVFFSPVFLVNSLTNKTGWIVYGIGIILYALSYFIQIFFSNTAFANSLPAFTAPAWTTIIWFAGIALLCNTSYLPIKNISYIYFGLSLFFSAVHVSHTVLVYIHNKTLS